MALPAPPTTPQEWAPRQRALAELCALDALTDPRTVLGRWCEGWPVPSELSFVEREGFPEVESEILESRWRVVRMGVFRFDESITVKEARVAVWALEHELRSANAHGRRSLRLVDNFGAVLSLS